MSDPYAQHPPPAMQPPPPMGHAPQPMPPAGGFHPYAAGPEINGKAVAALVCGLIFMTTPLGIMGLAFGKTAQRQIEAGYGIGLALAKAGRILGWVAVGFTIFWALYLVGGVIAVVMAANAVSGAV